MGERTMTVRPNGWHEYVYLNGQPMAERTSDGTWTDYIYASNQKIAKVASVDSALHLPGVNSTVNGQIRSTLGRLPLAGTQGYTVQTGDVLHFRQWSQNALGGLMLWFSNSTTFNGMSDADGQPISMDGVQGQWHERTVPLSAAAGAQVDAAFAINEVPAPDGAFDVWLGDIVIVSTDGSVHPIFHAQPGIVFTPTAWYAPTVSNLRGVSEPVPAAMVVAANEVSYYLEDHLGTAQMELTGSGWPVWQGQFTPFGQELDSGQTAMHYKFTGKERDTESGLDYFGARYYGSSMGRFMSPDPMNMSAIFHPDDPQSWNGYAYARNNPLTTTDPSGMTYQVCDTSGQNCSNVDDKTFESEENADRKQGEYFQNGSMFHFDGDGNKVADGSYKQTDVDGEGLSGAANQAGVNFLAHQTAPVVNAMGWVTVGAVGTMMGAEVAPVAGGGLSRLSAWGLQRLAMLAENPELKDVVARLYQATDQVPGGTAGAIRNGVDTGEYISEGGHVMKAAQRVQQLTRMLDKGTLSGTDRAIARQLISDLKGAIGR